MFVDASALRISYAHIRTFIVITIIIIIIIIVIVIIIIIIIIIIKTSSWCKAVNCAKRNSETIHYTRDDRNAFEISYETVHE